MLMFDFQKLQVAVSCLLSFIVVFNGREKLAFVLFYLEPEPLSLIFKSIYSQDRRKPTYSFMYLGLLFIVWLPPLEFKLHKSKDLCYVTSVCQVLRTVSGTKYISKAFNKYFGMNEK